MQKQSSEVLRPLGALEHLLWLLDRTHPMHLALTADIAGTADPGEWRVALDRVQARHPLLSARIAGGTASVPQFYRVAGKPIPLRVVEAEPEEGWQSEVHREFCAPFDPYEAPLIRAVLVQGRERTAFILSAHHSIIDGMSLAFLIRDTLAALGGEALDPMPLIPSMDVLAGLEESDGQAQAEAARGVPDAPRLPSWPKMQILRVEPALTARIRQRARQEGTSVHAALLTSIAIAGRQVTSNWQDIPLRILSPINNRKVLGIGDDCGVYASGATTTVPPDMFASAGFWDLARHASESLAPARSRDGIAMTLASLRRFTNAGPDVAAAHAFAATALAREAVLTNLGELPIGSHYGGLRLDAIWPAIQSGFGGGEQIIFAATMHGAICLTQSAAAPLSGLLPTMRDVLVRETA